VVSLDDLVHEWSESIVRIVGSSIHSDTRVGPFTSRENALSESESEFISSILALLPNISGKALLEQRGSSGWEVWESLNLFRVLKVRSHHGSVEIALGNGGSVLSTHLFLDFKDFIYIVNDKITCLNKPLSSGLIMKKI
jgi:hypothetical protein